MRKIKIGLLLAVTLLSVTLLSGCSSEKKANIDKISNKVDKETVENTSKEVENDKNSNKTDKQIVENKSDEVTDNTNTTTTNNNTSTEEEERDKIIDEVKNYILNGQQDKPEASKLKWSKRFLNEVDIESLYNDFLKVATKRDDVQEFANYITENAQILNNWEELFEKDVLETYQEDIVSIKHLEGDLYQGNIMVNGVETAFVTVSARTGYYHGTSEPPTEQIKGKVQLYEGAYFDSRRYGENSPNPYCEIVISNITDTTFDFTVYEIEYTDIANSSEKERKVIFKTNTANFTEDGTKATFYGHNYTLNFIFPDNHKAYPVVTDMEITGFKPLEGNVYLNNGIPGHEFG